MPIQTPKKPFRSIAEVEEYFFNALPAPKFSKKNQAVIDEAKDLFTKLGNPQNKPKTIHIAGTSGKGSVAYYLSFLLKEHGFLVGTHVSPHIYDIRERCLVDMEVPSEQDYLAVVNELVSKLKEEEELPTYFLVTLTTAFMMNAQKNVDYAVIETGMGGQYDPTNTIDRGDKIAVITRLGLDHTKVLGNTIQEIATQKAGIMMQGGLCIVLDQEPADVLDDVAAERDTTMIRCRTDQTIRNMRRSPESITFDVDVAGHTLKDLTIPTIAYYQLENVSIALRTLVALSERDGFEISEQKVKDALQRVSIPARMEISELNGKRVIIDGAHNPQKLELLTTSLRSAGVENSHWVFASSSTKDIKQMLEIVNMHADSVSFCSFFGDYSSNYLQQMAADPDKLQAIWKDISNKPSTVHERPIEALQKAIQDGYETIVISGSMYMIGDLARELVI